MSDTQMDPRTVQLKNVRLSFTEGLKDKKSAVKDGTPKHGCNIILDASKPEHSANMAALAGALNAASKQEWDREDMWKVISGDDPKRCSLRKGERFKNQESGEVYAGYEGNYGLSCSGPKGGQNRPKMYDRYKREVEEKDILDVCYSGSYADVIVSVYGTREGGNGVFCSIEGIRSRQEGERLASGGVAVSSDMFDDLPGEADAFSGTSSAGTSGGDFAGIG